MRTAFLILALASCGERERRETPVRDPAPAGGGDGAGQGGGAGDVAEGEGEERGGPSGTACPEGGDPLDCTDEAGDGEGEGEPGDLAECADDPLEPDNGPRSANRMRARSERGLILCPDDEDWFALDIRDGDGARAGLFAQGLRLELRNADDVVLAVAAGGDQAEAAVVDGEVVYARISGAVTATPYDLFFEAIPAAAPDPVEGEGEGEGEDPDGSCVADDLEPNADPGQARALAVGRQEGLSLCAGDEDWYSVRVGQGQRLTVTLEFQHVGGDLDLYLWGPGGPPDQLGMSAGGQDFELVAWDAPAASTVFVQVVGWAGAGNDDYDLTISLGEAPPPCQEDEHEPNESRFAAERLAPGDHGGLTVCAARQDDWFYVDIDEADDLEVTLTFRTNDGNLDLDLHKPSGSRVDRSATLRGEEVVGWRAEGDGRHAFRVYAASVRGVQGVPYQLEITVTTPEDRCGRDGGFEPNDSRNQAEEIEPRRHRDLQLCFEDEDWYALDLNGGDEFEVEIEFDHDEGDLDMQLFEPGSFSVWERSESHSDDERISATAEEAGEHLLRVFGEEAGYELIFEVDSCEPDAFEDNDSSNRAERLPPRDGRFNNLTQCGADEDWYSVDLDEGDDITARIDFRNADGNIDLHLHDSVGGQPEAESETFGNREEVSWRAVRSGNHLLRVFPRDDDAGGAVEYELTLTVVTADDRCPRDRSESNDSRFAARDIREGTTRDLTACGDDDWYEIDLDEGDEVTFEVRYDALDGDVNRNARLDLELHDPNGREEDDDRGSAGRCSVSHVAERDGDHHLRVFAVPDDAELEYEVTVSVRP